MMSEGFPSKNLRLNFPSLSSSSSSLKDFGTEIDQGNFKFIGAYDSRYETHIIPSFSEILRK